MWASSKDPTLRTGKVPLYWVGTEDEGRSWSVSRFTYGFCFWCVFLLKVGISHSY